LITYLTPSPHIYTYIHTYTYIKPSLPTHTHILTLSTPLHTHKYFILTVSTHTNIHIHVYAHINPHIYTYTHIPTLPLSTPLNTYLWTPLYPYIYTHTHINPLYLRSSKSGHSEHFASHHRYAACILSIYIVSIKYPYSIYLYSIYIIVYIIYLWRTIMYSVYYVL
jgi:hypothetical protein